MTGIGRDTTVLERLRELPVRYAELDPELVDEATRSLVDRPAVRAVVAAAHEFDCRVVAPRVASPRTAGELRRLGVDCGYGSTAVGSRPTRAGARAATHPRALTG